MPLTDVFLRRSPGRRAPRAAQTAAQTAARTAAQTPRGRAAWGGFYFETKAGLDSARPALRTGDGRKQQ